MGYSFLQEIKSPQDIKKLNTQETQALCEELRDCIIKTVSQNGGHLASNLGAVELTVALHKVFDSPIDSIIFDVGHQSYAHKLLTGRFNQFYTLRTKNGISGFMKPHESEHDPFITGHSSNSISAAYGIYKAKRLKGEEGTAVAVIGDGAMTGGMAYEALNNASGANGNFIVILNDNKMSISKSVGSFSKTLTRMRNRPKYHRFKSCFSHFLKRIPLVGRSLYRFFDKIKDIFKRIVYKNDIFTHLGFNYLGPVDGHNVAAMKSLFEIAKGYDKPSIIHVITTKGKGYQYAEESPNSYHGVSSFDVEKGAGDAGSNNFSAVAGETLCEMAKENNKICAITAAMTEGTGLLRFANEYPDRFFDVGIAEQHAVTFAAGLATNDVIPYFAVYSTFLQRSFDQIIHDMSIGNFSARLLIDRAGIVGEDGETHQGIFDVSYLSLIPGINIYSPATYDELRYRIKESAKSDELCAIRYPRGKQGVVEKFDYSCDFSTFKSNSNKLLITYGRLFSEALLAQKEADFDILKLNKIYPLSANLLKELANYKEIHFFEESVKKGGIAEHLSAILLQLNYKGKYKIHAINNKFVSQGKVSELLYDLKLDHNAMINAMNNKEK